MKHSSRSFKPADPLYSGLVFILFVTAGCAFIAVAKLYAISTLVVISVPILIMVGYALLVLTARAVRLRDDQTGDNLYYMGFLFTLTSLGVSLFQFSVAGAAEEIVRNFGIAITSTIAGIALRVFFNQMRRDPVEVEQAGRLELAEAARRVRRELDSTAIEFSQFRKVIQQSTRDGYEEIRQDIDQITSNFLASLDDVAAKASTPLEQVSARSSASLEAMTNAMAKSLESAGKRLSEESDRLAIGAGEIAKALGTTATRLAEMKTPDQVVEVRLSPLVNSLTKAIKEFSAKAEANQADISRVVGLIESQQRQQTQLLEGAGSAIQQIAQTLSAARERNDA